MAFGLSKPGTRHRELSDLPNDWVGWLEPGVEVEGKMKVTGGLIRLNSFFKGDIVSDGAVVVHDQGEVEGNIQSRVVSITGKVKGTVHAKERLTPEGSSTVSATCLHLNQPLSRPKGWGFPRTPLSQHR
jgi:hypothetical protein